MKKLFFLSLIIIFSTCKKKEDAPESTPAVKSIYSVRYNVYCACDAEYRDNTGNIIKTNSSFDKTFTNLPCGFNAYLSVYNRVAGAGSTCDMKMDVKISSGSSTVAYDVTVPGGTTKVFNEQLFCK